MTTWSTDDLQRIDGQDEIRIAAYRPDRTLRDLRIVWHVVVNDSLYVRSARGTEGAWYRGVMRTGAGVIEVNREELAVTFAPDDTHDDAIDDAYRAKYGTGSPVRVITSTAARATTLRVDPA